MKIVDEIKKENNKHDEFLNIKIIKKYKFTAFSNLMPKMVR